MFAGARSKSLAICQTISLMLRGLAVALFDQRVVDRPLDLLFRHGQADAAMALRIDDRPAASYAPGAPGTRPG